MVNLREIQLAVTIIQVRHRAQRRGEQEVASSDFVVQLLAAYMLILPKGVKANIKFPAPVSD